MAGISPFQGDVSEGWVWGRGALDNKGGDAMMIAALLRVKEENAALPGDVILAMMSDEEGGSKYGRSSLLKTTLNYSRRCSLCYRRVWGFQLLCR